MKPLLEIAESYNGLRQRSIAESNEFFASDNLKELMNKWNRGDLTPDFKKTEREAEKEIERFVNEAMNLLDSGKYSVQYLISEISKQANSENINHNLLINLIWRLREENCSDEIEERVYKELTNSLLISEILEQPYYYYLESYIDIWNSSRYAPVPLDILKEVILLKPNSDETHALTLKAPAYLKRHGQEAYDRTFEEIKRDKKYKKSQYYIRENTLYNNG